MRLKHVDGLIPIINKIGIYWTPSSPEYSIDATYVGIGIKLIVRPGPGDSDLEWHFRSESGIANSIINNVELILPEPDATYSYPVLITYQPYNDEVKLYTGDPADEPETLSLPDNEIPMFRFLISPAGVDTTIEPQYDIRKSRCEEFVITAAQAASASDIVFTLGNNIALGSHVVLIIDSWRATPDADNSNTERDYSYDLGSNTVTLRQGSLYYSLVEGMVIDIEYFYDTIGEIPPIEVPERLILLTSLTYDIENENDVRVSIEVINNSLSIVERVVLMTELDSWAIASEIVIEPIDPGTSKTYEILYSGVTAGTYQFLVTGDLIGNIGTVTVPALVANLVWDSIIVSQVTRTDWSLLQVVTNTGSASSTYYVEFRLYSVASSGADEADINAPLDTVVSNTVTTLVGGSNSHIANFTGLASGFYKVITFVDGVTVDDIEEVWFDVEAVEVIDVPTAATYKGTRMGYSLIYDPNWFGPIGPSSNIFAVYIYSIFDVSEVATAIGAYIDMRVSPDPSGSDYSVKRCTPGVSPPTGYNVVHGVLPIEYISSFSFTTDSDGNDVVRMVLSAAALMVINAASEFGVVITANNNSSGSTICKLNLTY